MVGSSLSYLTFIIRAFFFLLVSVATLLSTVFIFAMNWLLVYIPPPPPFLVYFLS